MTEERILGKRYDGGMSPLQAIRRRGLQLSQVKDALMMGNDKDTVVLPSGSVTSLGDVRAEARAMGLGGEMTDAQQDKVLRTIERKLRVFRREQETASVLADHQKARTLLHDVLRGWSRGALKLERPQASSIHHLIEYDTMCGGQWADQVVKNVEMQNFIVENDWAKIVPAEVSGEWRLPFKYICWEFRIDGVRVLCFTMAEDIENPYMFCVYGKEHVWVSDDYIYIIGQQALGAKRAHNKDTDHHEFRRVAEKCFANIRASCIMLDAKVARGEEVPVSAALVKRSKAQGRVAPRKHHVVRLLRPERQRYARNEQRSGVGSGVHQRGHWRPGRWLHYDHDGGSVKYVNDGGFWVSKSWQSWHFAGDMNNMVDKEYRL